MSRLRQLTRSSPENGGSAATFCRAKTQTSRIILEICQPAAVWTKNFLSLSSDTSMSAFSRYSPARAFWSAVSLMSVAKIWTEYGDAAAWSASKSAIAIE